MCSASVVSKSLLSTVVVEKMLFVAGWRIKLMFFLPGHMGQLSVEQLVHLIEGNQADQNSVKKQVSRTSR